MDLKAKLVELLDEAEEWADHKCDVLDCEKCPADKMKGNCVQQLMVDRLIVHGVTVQEWIPASEPPKENGYYLCVILFSAVGSKKEYRRKILFWEDNVWIEMANCFRTVKPLYWMPMAEMPQPPKGE